MTVNDDTPAGASAIRPRPGFQSNPGTTRERREDACPAPPISTAARENVAQGLASFSSCPQPAGVRYPAPPRTRRYCGSSGQRDAAPLRASVCTLSCEDPCVPRNQRIMINTHARGRRQCGLRSPSHATAGALPCTHCAASGQDALRAAVSMRACASSAAALGCRGASVPCAVAISSPKHPSSNRGRRT